MESGEPFLENYFEMNLPKGQIDAISNLGLAHIGDAVYELLCRSCLCAQGHTNVLELHKRTVAMVKAPAQAEFIDRILPTPAQYAKATGLEALFGRLYLEGKTERINALFCLGLEGGESHGL